MQKDPYKVLGVPTNADEATIKKAYRELSKKYHPDVDPSPEAESKFKEISEAYSIVGDSKKRSEYDLSKKNPKTYAGVDFTDIFKDIFNPYGFNNRGGGSFSNTNQEKRKPDFSEIEKLDNEIKEYDEILNNITQDISDYNVKIKEQRKLIEEEIREIRRNKTKEENYIKAIKYIEKFKRRDSNRLISLTITEKQYDLYRSCIELLEQMEQQIKEFRKTLEVEKVEPLEKKQDEKEEEYWRIFHEKYKIRNVYLEHPLKYEYEKMKRDKNLRKGL